MDLLCLLYHRHRCCKYHRTANKVRAIVSAEFHSACFLDSRNTDACTVFNVHGEATELKDMVVASSEQAICMLLWILFYSLSWITIPKRRSNEHPVEVWYGHNILLLKKEHLFFDTRSAKDVLWKTSVVLLGVGVGSYRSGRFFIRCMLYWGSNRKYQTNRLL